MRRSRRKSFMSYRLTEQVPTALLMTIAERMAQGDYRAVSRLFGADVGLKPEDDEPVSLADLPKFGQGERPPTNEDAGARRRRR